MAANTHSLDLESTSSQFATLPDVFINCLSADDTFTIEFWIKPESIGGSGNLVYSAALTSTFYAFVLSTGAIRFYCGSGGTPYLDTSAGVITAGSYYHVALVKESATTANIYINGSLSATTSSLTGNTLTGSAGEDLYIGKYSDGEVTKFYYDGLVDEFRVWNVARTAGEIAANIYADVTGQTGLQGYWKLNNDYVDSANARNGSGGGTPVFSTDVPFAEYLVATTTDPSYSYFM
jgi:hypothetical protein